MSSAETKPEDSAALLRLRLALTLLLLLQAAGALFPGPLLWGINHLAQAPQPIGVVWPLLGILLVWTWIGRAWGRILSRVVGTSLLGNRWTAYLIVPLLGAAVFWLIRMRTHLLGDGWLLGELVAAGTPFSGYEFISYHAHARLFALLDLTGQAAALRLFAVSSVITGGAYLAAAAWSARALARDGGSRALLYGLWLWHTPLLLFMGYVECYAILTVALLVFATQLVRYYRGEVSPLAPATALAVGLLFHLNALFLAPLLLPMLFWPARADRRSWIRRLLLLAAPPLLALGLGAGIYLLAGYGREWFAADFEAGHRLVRPFAALPGTHGLLSALRWKDFANLLLLLVPVPLAILVVSRPWHRVRAVLVAGCLWLLLLMAIVNYKLGLVRDWDLFAAHSAVFVLAAWLAVRHRAEQPGGDRVVGMVLGAAIVLSAPWFWLNAGEERSYRRIRETITDLSYGAQGYAHEEIGKYLRSRDRIAEAIEAYEQSLTANPDNPRVRAVLGALFYNGGQYDAAIATFHRVLDQDSTIVLALETLARAHEKLGNPDSALVFARRLAGHPEEPVAAAEFHGRLAEERGLASEAAAAFERAYREDPARIDLLERVGGIGLLSQDYELAERVFRAVLRRDSRSVSARTGLVIALWEPLRTQEPSEQRAQVPKLREAAALLDGLIREEEASGGMRAWREEIRQALGESRP